MSIRAMTATVTTDSLIDNATDSAVGMMDAAYFTSRKDILDFINNLLQLNLTKIEQTASGAVACQIVEYIYPGSIPLHRVNWCARSDYEFVQNYKLLQAAFNKFRVSRHVDVDRLIRAKYQDNLEFCQWLKAFYDQTAPSTPRENYDPVAARCKGKGGKDATKRFQKTADQHGSKLLPTDRPAQSTRTSIRPLSRGCASRENGPRPGTAKRVAPSEGSSVGAQPDSSWSQVRPESAAKARVGGSAASLLSNRSSLSVARQQPRRKVSRDSEICDNKCNVGQPTNKSDTKNTSSLASSKEATIVADVALLKKNAELAHRNAELELTVSGIEGERDFYFEKLRDVEVMLQIHRESHDTGGSENDEIISNAQEGDGAHSKSDEINLVNKLFKVLYATADQKISVNPETRDLMGQDAGGPESAAGNTATPARQQVSSLPSSPKSFATLPPPRRPPSSPQKDFAVSPAIIDQKTSAGDDDMVSSPERNGTHNAPSDDGCIDEEIDSSDQLTKKLIETEPASSNVGIDVVEDDEDLLVDI